MGKMSQSVLPVGSISTGTMLASDLIPDFLAVADSLFMSKEQRANVRRYHVEWNRIANVHHDKWTDEQRDGADDLLGKLFELLDAFTPDYCYFGAHEGDGANYGVWPSSDVPFHGPATGEIGKGDSLPPADADAPDHFLVVTDHGNATLYRKRRQGKNHRWVECWSVV